MTFLHKGRCLDFHPKKLDLQSCQVKQVHKTLNFNPTLDFPTSESELERRKIRVGESRKSRN